jgi:tetratricopeptide (TPR) repeat protein
MLRKVLSEWLLTFAAAAVILVASPLPAAFCQDAAVEEAGRYNRQGMVYFERGFYDHAPKKESAEAERFYGLAVKEFKSAIARAPSLTGPHRNLARVYYVQKNFAGAAGEYRRVTELAPADLDAYINLALALIELNRDDEAIKALENAKGQTSDPKALATLDDYISKVRNHRVSGER